MRGSSAARIKDDAQRVYPQVSYIQTPGDLNGISNCKQKSCVRNGTGTLLEFDTVVNGG